MKSPKTEADIFEKINFEGDIQVRAGKMLERKKLAPSKAYC